MMSKGKSQQDERILILAPTGKDAEMTARYLNEAGFSTEICRKANDLSQKNIENAGLLFLTEEALTPEVVTILNNILKNQLPWSDIPLLILTSGGGNNSFNTEILKKLSEYGNINLIERPVRLMTLISTINSAIRARRRQYEARDFLLAEIRSKEDLRRSEQQLRIALSAAHLGAWELDLKNLKLDSSPSCKANFGLPPEAEFSYQQLFELIHPEDRDNTRQAVERSIQEQVNYKAEYRIIWHDNSQHWIMASGSINYDRKGNANSIVGVTLDITERKLAEKEREALLESEKIARTQAEQANRLKDEFLATVSHELRTPLNAILGWATMALKNNLDTETTGYALKVIERNARNQNQIISDILDVSRIITGKLQLHLRPLNLSQNIQAAIDTVRPSLEARHIQLESDFDSKNERIMSGDPDRLQQIIWNILSNAVKFTPEGGKIKIVLQYRNDLAEIIITDNGIGIEPEFLPFVFDRFRQADGKMNRKHGGLGLGLAVVRNLAELHGGQVFVESEGIGCGSTFTIQLPLVAVLSKSTSISSANGNTNGNTNIENTSEKLVQPKKLLEGIKILVVDNESDGLELTAFILSEQGGKVLTAESVDSALKIFDYKTPDIIISDIGMPEKDGFELHNEINKRSRELNQSIPMIALTAFAGDNYKSKILKAGFQAFLPKPVESSELIKTVSKIVKIQ